MVISKNLFGACALLMAVHCLSTLGQAQSLSKMAFKAASVLPVTQYRGKQVALLSREASGPNKNTYDAFGGSREHGENHPVVTASRELAEETIYLLGDPKRLRTYIDLPSGNTNSIIANLNKQCVIYVTHFNPKKLQHLTSHFYSARNQATRAAHLEKDKLAWVNWDDLMHAIAHAPRNSMGLLKLPISVQAHVIQKSGALQKTSINLRPVFVSSMQSFFKNQSNYTVGKNPKIRFYSR